MNQLPIHQQDYLDIIFAHHNKAYGAYQQRMNYPKRVFMSITAIFGTVLSIAAYIYFFQSPVVNDSFLDRNIPPIVFDNKPVVFENPKDKPKEDIVKRQKETPKVNTKKFTADIKIVDNKIVKPDDKISQPDDKHLAGPKNEEGPGKITDQLKQEEKIGKEIILEEKKDPIVAKPEEPSRQADIMPEYPGGTQALLRYLNSNLRYPIQAQEAGLMGKVIVEFVVDEQGEISRIKVLKGLGMGCSEEAVRVVRNMKRWKPGMYQGKPRAVYYVLPIEFSLQQ